MPEPARVPIAAAHQMVADVFRPRTLAPSFRITPPPRNPIPETIWAAILAAPSPPRRDPSIRNAADPHATSALVLGPAILWWYARSVPISAPNARATARRRANNWRGRAFGMVNQVVPPIVT